MTTNDIAMLLILLSIVILITALLGVLFWYFVFFKYKHFVEIINLRGGKERVRIKKAKDFLLPKSSAKVWKIRWCRDLPWTPIPPEDLIEQTDKGKNFVRLYVTETGDIIFAKASHPKLIPHFNELLKDIPSWITNIPHIARRQDEYDKWRTAQIEIIQKEAGDNYIVFKPYTSTHRVMQTTEVQKAAEQRNKGMGDRLQAILNLAPVAILALVVIVGIIFWADMNKSATEKQAEITKQEAQITEQWQIIKEIHQNTQGLNPNVPKNGTKIPY